MPRLAVNHSNEILNPSTFSTPPSPTAPNLLGSSGAATIEATFTVPVGRVQALIALSGGVDTLEVFDAGGNSLGSAGGDDVEVSLSSGTPIARFVARATSGTTPAIDNLEFDGGPGTIGTVYCAPGVPNRDAVGGTATANITSAVSIAF